MIEGLVPDYVPRYVGPALLTIEGGREWQVQVDLVTTFEVIDGSGPLWSWDGYLECRAADIIAAACGPAVLTLPDGRDGALYCGCHVTQSVNGSDTVTILEVTGNGPAPYWTTA